MTSIDSKPKKRPKKSLKKAVDSDLIRRLYQFIEPYRWWVLLAVVLVLGSSYLGTIRPKLTQIAVDEYITNQDIDGLWWIILLLIGALIGEFFLLVANTFIMRWFGQGALFNLRNAIFRKIQSLHVQFFDKNAIGKLITRTTNDIEALSDLLSSGVVNIIGDSFRIIFILFFMFSMSWELTLVSLLTLPILFYATFIFKAKVRQSFLNVRDRIAKLNSFLQEHINGMGVVQLFNRVDTEREKYKEINDSHKQAHINTIFYFALFWPTVEVLASLAMALVLWYGGGRALMGGVTFGILLAFIQYVRQFFQPIRGLSERFNTLQSALASSERLFNILDEENQVPEPEHPKKIGEPKGRIAFENVWFTYNDEEDYVLKDVSFEAPEGDTIAIVGATGAGKSTIINLLLRFYDINKGEIYIDGVPIKDYELTALRENIGVVLQDVFLFSDTISQNINLGNEKIDPQKILEAADLVGARSFIEKLPGGIEYNVMERGATLSVGQRQLISFVRAMVYNPKIIVLDEATSSVDTETEELIQNAIEKLMKGRTSIVIAHRLSTIQKADKILVLDKGEIKERGTHDELLAMEGYYTQLHKMQYKEVI